MSILKSFQLDCKLKTKILEDAVNVPFEFDNRSDYYNM